MWYEGWFEQEMSFWTALEASQARWQSHWKAWRESWGWSRAVLHAQVELYLQCSANKLKEAYRSDKVFLMVM